MSPKNRLLRRLVPLVAVFGLLTLYLPSGVTAKERHTEVVASGLNNPRGISFGPDGALYVAEAGKGGNGPCAQAAEGLVCLGKSGAITKVWDDGQERIVKGLPSIALADGSAALGPHDVSLKKHLNMYIPVGLGGSPELRSKFGVGGRLLGHLIRANAQGDWEPIVDLAGYEAEANPDGGPVDSNPYAVLARGGRRIVADAGGNALNKVDADGNVSTIATFPNRNVNFNGSVISMHAVPDSVVRGPDGAYYVGQLTGYPFPVGGARVYRIVPGHAPEIYARGFTNIIDLAFDSEGTLYVLEIAHNSLLAPEPHGALLRVDSDGSSEVLLEELFFPAGLAIDHDDRFYISNCGVCPGVGEVLRFEP